MFYSLKEGFAGLCRAKFSSIFAISIISISLIIIGLFLIVILNTKRLVDSIQERIELEVFIDNSLDSLKTEQLKIRILASKGIRSIKYVSKDEAAEFFKQQFDKDIFKILDENPLPASFQITLVKAFQTSQDVNQLSKDLKKIDGVDDVIFRQDILILLERYMEISLIVISIIGGLLAAGSIYLVSNTVKLIMLSRLQIIETMKLVGATKHFIRRPFIFEGLIQGIIGSVLAVSFIYIILKIINIEVTQLIIVNEKIFLILFAVGVFLGLLGSMLAIQRFLKY